MHYLVIFAYIYYINNTNILLISSKKKFYKCKIELFSIFNYMTINERFGILLKEKNISVKEFSAMIGKSEGYVRKLLVAD